MDQHRHFACAFLCRQSGLPHQRRGKGGPSPSLRDTSPRRGERQEERGLPTLQGGEDSASRGPHPALRATFPVRGEGFDGGRAYPIVTVAGSGDSPL